MKQYNTNKKSNAKSIAFLIIPYLTAVIATVLIAVFLYIYITTSGLVQLLINDFHVDDSPFAKHNAPQTDVISNESQEKFPVIKFASQWATLNVEGWETKNVPVFLGDTFEILLDGAGMAMHSEFCGKGGRTVIDAHVTTFFRELENTKVGAKVKLSTVYGDYVYTVDRLQIFDRYDSQYILPSKEKDELVMYTCYPYNNHYKLRTQRAALICSLTQGKEW